MQKNSKIDSLEFLRGVAVLLVCFCHFSKPFESGPVTPQIFNWLSDNGKYGVEIFFVISGFVIPYSLHRSDYQIANFFSFIYKRFLRLHPPYLIALFLTLIIAFASYTVRHLNYSETPITIFESLFYGHAPADNPVFWTLGVEAEYYIFIGIFYPLLKRHTAFVLLLVVPFLLIISRTEVAGHIFLLNFLSFFFLGVVGFLLYTKLANIYVSIVSLLIVFVFCCLYNDSGGVVFALLTLLFILFYKATINPVLKLPGKISYSLYLIHFPIGTKIINLSIRFVPPMLYWPLFFITTFLCLLAAIIYWKYIEHPCAVLSNKIKYKRKNQREVVPVSESI